MPQAHLYYFYKPSERARTGFTKPLALDRIVRSVHHARPRLPTCHLNGVLMPPTGFVRGWARRRSNTQSNTLHTTQAATRCSYSEIGLSRSARVVGGPTRWLILANGRFCDSRSAFAPAALRRDSLRLPMTRSLVGPLAGTGLGLPSRSSLVIHASEGWLGVRDDFRNRLVERVA